MKNVFLNGRSKDILKSVAQLRALKLALTGNFSPVVAYYPDFLGRKISFKNSNVTVEGEHLVSMDGIFEEWIQNDVKAGHVLFKDGKIVGESLLWKNLFSSSINSNIIIQENPFLKEKTSPIAPENLLPVHKNLGMLSKKSKNALLSFNSLFFAMEVSDMENRHTYFGQPYGLTINRGKIITPPLFKRGAFFIYNDGNSKVKTISIENIIFKVGNVKLIPSNNCEVWRRPQTTRTPKSYGAVDMVVVNDQIVSWKEDGDTDIPDAGFVIRVDKRSFLKFRTLNISYEYEGLNNISFAIQGGPILLKNGVVQKGFNTEEFGGKIRYPPTVFPFDWNQTPAARIAIGCTQKNEVVILAVEGCNNHPYEVGLDSRGFTLEELSETLEGLGVKNAINLDGGGSMQVRFLNAKALRYADRRGVAYHEFERPIPAAVFI